MTVTRAHGRFAIVTNSGGLQLNHPVSQHDRRSIIHQSLRCKFNTLHGPMLSDAQLASAHTGHNAAVQCWVGQTNSRRKETVFSTHSRNTLVTRSGHDTQYICMSVGVIGCTYQLCQQQRVQTERLPVCGMQGEQGNFRCSL